MNLPSVDALGDLRGRRVLVRADLNVPLDAQAGVRDAFRVTSVAPTVQALAETGARVVVASHLGRPNGADPAKSLAVVAPLLAEHVGRDVLFVPAQDGMVAGEAARAAVAGLEPGQVCLLENLRYEAGETCDDRDLAISLAALCDVYVNDAFGTMHRAHASVHALPRLMGEGQVAAGPLVQREVGELAPLIEAPERPFVAILGGAKVSDKVGVIENLLPRLDGLLIGGGMANTFMAARGVDMGASRVEEKGLDIARGLLGKLPHGGLVLPVDLRVGAGPGDPAGYDVVKLSTGIPGGLMALDIGPRTEALFIEALRQARTVLWNGPLGVFETPAFACGTRAVAHYLAWQSFPRRTVVGGGDTVAAVREFGVADRIGHVSTGGGAALELLEGRKLPGLVALEEVVGARG